MRKGYAAIDTDPVKLLQAAARLHVALGRMDGQPISTRGWTYNDLVHGIIVCGDAHLETLFDTLGALTEIGANAISYLNQWPDLYASTDKGAV